MTDLDRTVVVVSSKSGGTIETESHRRAFVAAFTEVGLDEKEVGRYSALSAFGLVPAALAGVDHGVVGHPMARASLVDARLDASLRRRGTNLAAHLGERHGRPAVVRLVGKGENPWSPSLRREIAERAPAGLVIADLGVRAGDIAPGVPTILVDHHVPTGTPGDALVISGNGCEPEPTSVSCSPRWQRR